MEIKTLFKSILIAAFCAGLVTVGYHVLFPSSNKVGEVFANNALGWKFPVAKFPLTGAGDNLFAYSDIRDPGGVPQGLPIRLKIPIIGVDSAIEDALITPDGRMDVPVGSVNVAWFALGPYPGQEGSAVIGGHFGINNGASFVFYKLDRLKIGDEVYIVNDRGETLAFVVRSIKLFDRDADATTVFTSEDGLAHLNLITCEGVWNRVDDTYPERRVVFTDAISGKGEVVPAPTIFRRSLNIGARGADVSVLQSFLEQRGFLKMPLGVAKGFFGYLTYAALAGYQVSVGLPPVGVFGMLTRDKLISEQSMLYKPALPLTATRPPEAPSFFRTLAQLLKSLYASPGDKMITFSLLAAILFVGFKIIMLRKRMRQ
ncbi:MAG: sortase [Candidatus Liptonbacteria bacterium]